MNSHRTVVSKAAAAVAVAVALFALSTAARELVPFPSQQMQQQNAPVQQTAPSSQGYYLTEFQRSIAQLDCPRLQELKNKLTTSQNNTSNRADKQYYGQLLEFVEQRRTAQHCRT
jgi:hypothetical protein